MKKKIEKILIINSGKGGNLRKIQKKPNSTQRELALELGFSLGKLNYCLKALQKKGLVKIENYTKLIFKYPFCYKF